MLYVFSYFTEQALRFKLVNHILFRYPKSTDLYRYLKYCMCPAKILGSVS